MPAPGDQYRDTPATVNPFAEKQPQINGYTAQEIATLQSRLDKQLGPEYISTRPGNGGGKVHYLAAEKVINLANEVFGFNGWSSAIQNVQIDFVDENAATGRVNLGLSTIVRVTLRDGTYHEDIGYGHCENTKGKAAAFEKAKKEAATDAMKRALRNFGNVLGNCLYDKDYLQKITKIKVAPSRWDAENLHRHPDYAPIKREAIADNPEPPARTSTVARQVSAHTNVSLGEIDDEFGGNIFEEADYAHPDEVRLDDSRVSESVSTGPAGRPGQPQSAPRQVQPPAQPAQPPRQGIPPRPTSYTNPRAQHPQTPLNPPGPRPQNADLQKVHNSSANPASDSPSRQAAGRQATEAGVPAPTEGPQPVPMGNPEGFVAARQAEILQQPREVRSSTAVLAFNPHAESPSIRRTQGVNPGKSVPISRHQIQSAGGAVAHAPHHVSGPSTIGGQQGLGTSVNGVTTSTSTAGINIVNPAADSGRRVGMPPGGGPISRGGGSYRTPTAIKRPAMADVTNIQQFDGATDGKKLKTGSEGPVPETVQSAGVT